MQFSISLFVWKQREIIIEILWIIPVFQKQENQEIIRYCYMHILNFNSIHVIGLCVLSIFKYSIRIWRIFQNTRTVKLKMEHSNKSQYLQVANWHSRETENLEPKKKKSSVLHFSKPSTQKWCLTHSLLPCRSIGWHWNVDLTLSAVLLLCQQK